MPILIIIVSETTRMLSTHRSTMEVTYLLEIIHHVPAGSIFDVLKTVPLLLVVYAPLYYIENRLTNTPELLSRAAQFGPVVGALAGSIPSADFPRQRPRCSRQAFFAPATLVAVFLATSDEAVPIMLAAAQAYSRWCCCSWSSLRSRSSAAIFCAAPCSGGTRPEPTARLRSRWATAAVRTSPVANIPSHTIKSTIFLFVVLFALNMVVHGIGEERVASPC